MCDKKPIVKVDPDEFFSEVAINRARLIAGIWGNPDVALSEEAMSLLYPLRDWGEHGDSGEIAPKHYRLSWEDREFIETVIEGPLNLRKITSKLIQKCGRSESSLADLHWPDIAEDLKVYAENKATAMERTDTPPPTLLAKLSKQQQDMVSILWGSPMTFQEFTDTIWPGPVNPETYNKAINRLNDKFAELNKSITAIRKGDYVSLDRPDKLQDKL